MAPPGSSARAGSMSRPLTRTVGDPRKLVVTACAGVSPCRLSANRTSAPAPHLGDCRKRHLD